jgi:DNA-binding LytR/AlgR family response regulator
MSKIINCAIIDDEPPAIRLLEKYVAKVPFLNLVFSSTNPIEALAKFQSETIDLVFLDIQMPNITGIQLSKIIDNKTKVIFTTAYSEYAIDSYNVNALDYLLKPFTFDRFYKAVLKTQKSSENTVKNVQEKPYIFVKTDGKNNLEKVNIDDITFIEGLKNYVAINQKHKQIITYNTLKHFQENLSENKFVKIHKSFLVSLEAITKTTSISVFIDDKELPIGNTYKNEFFEKLNKYRI